jgi:hypothetical protein
MFSSVQFSFKVHTEIFRENAHKFPDANAAVNSLDLAVTFKTPCITTTQAPLEPLNQLDFTSAFLSA